MTEWEDHASTPWRTISPAQLGEMVRHASLYPSAVHKANFGTMRGAVRLSAGSSPQTTSASTVPLVLLLHHLEYHPWAPSPAPPLQFPSCGAGVLYAVQLDSLAHVFYTREVWACDRERPYAPFFSGLCTLANSCQIEVIQTQAAGA